MSKDRPFKNFKSPSERPFKVYNPSSPSTTSMLFQDPQQQEQPLRLGGINGLMPQQQQQQHHQQQQQQQQQQQHMPYGQQQASSTLVPQVYGDPEDYLHLNPQRLGQNPIMSLDPTLNSYYEELGLDDPDNPLIRPELLNDSILQREQDLNIDVGGQNPAGMQITPSFLLQNRHLQQQRGSAGSSSMAITPPVTSMHNSLSMLFDQSQPAMNPFLSSSTLQQQQHSSSTLQQQQQQQQQPQSSHLHHHQQQQQQQQHLAKSGSDRSSTELSLPPNGSQFLSSMAAATGQSSAMAASAMMGGSSGGGGGQSVNGRSSMTGDILPSSSGINMDQSFSIKREADEGQSGLTDDSPSPSSIQSPSQSDSFVDTPKSSRNLKRSHSNGSNCGNISGQESSSKRESKDSEGDSSDAQRDPAYLEKRRKNNESAKRSREARRNKEELVALRVITLEEENMKLRAEIGLLDKELDELRTRLFS